MLIFEFGNGSIVNLLTFESLTVMGDRYFLTCQSGTKYELSKEEFIKIKQTFKEKLTKI